MTGRERLERTFDGLPVDRIPLTTLVDDITRKNMPDEYRNLTPIEFYRRMGYDVLQFGDYGMPEHLWTIPPYEIRTGYTVERETQGNVYIERRIMDGEALEIHISDNHPVKHPVTTEEELELLCRMWESVEVIELSGEALQKSLESYRRMDEAIGDIGIFTPTVDQSGVQHLLEYEMGLENFYYLLEDAPELVERAIEAVQKERRARYELLAKHLDFIKTVIPVENTSSLLISPKLYRKYSLPHMQEYAQIMHKYGKKAVIHMCGALLALLPELKEVGLDGIHGLTPPPIGTCPYEAALDALGEDLIVITTYGTEYLRDEALTDEEKRKCMEDTLTPRVKAGNFIFGLVSDGMETDLSLFTFVRDVNAEIGTK